MGHPGNHKITHLFEELDNHKKTRRKLTLQKKRNALLFLEKSFPFLGRLNGFDLSKKFGGRLSNQQERSISFLTMPVISAGSPSPRRTECRTPSPFPSPQGERVGVRGSSKVGA
jgi:hypothetical protein